MLSVYDLYQIHFNCVNIIIISSYILKYSWLTSVLISAVNYIYLNSFTRKIISRNADAIEL